MLFPDLKTFIPRIQKQVSFEMPNLIRVQSVYCFYRLFDDFLIRHLFVLISVPP